MSVKDHQQELVRASELIDGGFAAPAIELLRDSVSELDAAGDRTETLIEALILLARALGKQHDWRVFPLQERELLERAAQLASVVHGEAAEKTAGVRRMLAISLAASGAPSEALPLMKLVSETTERKYGAGPVLASTLIEVARLHLELGDFDHAYGVYSQCLAMAADHGDRRLNALVRLGLAEALLGLGRAAEALPVAEAALEDCVARFGPRSHHVSEFERVVRHARACANPSDS